MKDRKRIFISNYQVFNIVLFGTDTSWGIINI